MATSSISAFLSVRSFLLGYQRQLAASRSVIMDGRDIGTVILPDATVKIFLTASPEARARRRFLELKQRGEAVLFEDVFAELCARDMQDEQRAAAPLRQAEGAVLLDTSNLDFDQSLRALVTIIREKVGL